MSAASALKAAEARVAAAKAEVAAAEAEFAAATALVPAEEAEAAGAVVAADISTAAGADTGPSEQRLIGRGGKKRKQPYSSDDSDTNSDDDVYNSDRDSDGKPADVEKYNYKSFKSQAEDRLWKQGLPAYINRYGRYFCQFHEGKKIPKNGLRCGLVEHAKAVSQGFGARSLRDQGNHAALYAVLKEFGG